MPDESLPNTKTRNIPFLALVTRADPDRIRAMQNQVEFEFGDGKRVFTHNPNTRGPYADD